MDADSLKRRVKFLLGFFMFALIVSGLTAIPLKWEIDILENLIGNGTSMESLWSPLSSWISYVHQGITETDYKYPFIAYGTDWLAYAHIMIAIAFIGPLRDPVKNIWIIEWGMIACVSLIFVALIFGYVRGIPPLWRFLDCTFGILGFGTLFAAHKYINQIAILESSSAV